MPGDRDNFELINGIGEQTARQLHQSGIHRFSELALFTPQELTERVKEIVPVQQIENEDWTGQARELAMKKLKPSTPKKLPAGERPLASFLVIFMETIGEDGKAVLSTVVNHENGQTKKWESEIATDELVKWMLTMANLPGHPAAEQPRPSTKEKSGFFVPEDELEEDVELTITDLKVSQVIAEGQVNEPNLQKPVRVEGSLSLEGADAHSLTYEAVPFNIKFTLFNLEGNLSNVVATYKGQLEPDKLIYGFQKDFPIPERGRYRLSLTARLLFPFAAEVEEEGPVLRVGL
jgi:hypothetical protein